MPLFQLIFIISFAIPIAIRMIMNISKAVFSDVWEDKHDKITDQANLKFQMGTAVSRWEY